LDVEAGAERLSSGVIILDIALLKGPDIVLWLGWIRSQFCEIK
jgi:hypothetical protein